MRRSVDIFGFLSDMLILCFKFNGSVTSWIRTEIRNASVGGTGDSLHLYGYAVDIVLDDEALYDEAIDFAHSLDYDCEYHRGHLHVEYDPKFRQP